MKKTKWLPIIVSLVCLAGCAAKPVEKDWIAVGGSRSDATIRLGYTYNPKIEVPLPEIDNSDIGIRLKQVVAPLQI